MTQATDLIDDTRIASRDAALAARTLVLKSREFRKGREDGWRELEGLVERVAIGFRVSRRAARVRLSRLGVVRDDTPAIS